MSSLSTINDTIEQAAPELTLAQRQNLTQVLIEREDHMADMFRLAGMQFGLYPWIVAEVFAEVGIGTPVDDTQREMIRAQFVAGMEELQRQFGQGQ